MTDQDLAQIIDAINQARGELELRRDQEPDLGDHLTEAAHHLQTAHLSLRLALEHLRTQASQPCPPPNPDPPPAWRPWYKIDNVHHDSRQAQEASA